MAKKQSKKASKVKELTTEQSLRDLMLEKVATYIRENRRVPSRQALASIGISKDQYRRQFTTIANMVDQVVDFDASVLDYILTGEQIFTPEMVNRVENLVKNKKRFIITTAVTGMPVNEAFLNSIKNYCTINDAGLLVLPTTDPAAAVPFELDPILKDEAIIIQDININDNLMVSTFQTSAKQINTLTGLRRVGERERSMIVASPKQFVEYVPVLNPEGCHALLTTGAITTPEYLSTDKYMSLRTAWLADKDHEMGGIIVEVESDKIFHFRPFQCAVDGSFMDLGVRYSFTSRTRKRPEAIVLGDIHVGSIDKDVYRSTNRILKQLQPKRVFLHDVFDGVSCNPHASMQFLTQAQLKDKLSIEKELQLNGKYLTHLREKHPYVEEWIVVRSNHDIFLDRYLDGGDYIQDPTNFEICHKLALKKMKGEIPFEAGLIELGFDLTKINFLDEDESYRIHGFECGQHGHRGSNGVRNPSNAGLEVAYGKGVFGHSHTGGKLRKIFRVGTSTRYKLGYNKGASSWTHTLCIVNPDGTAQLVNDIKGKWRLK